MPSCVRQPARGKRQIQINSNSASRHAFDETVAREGRLICSASRRRVCVSRSRMADSCILHCVTYDLACRVKGGQRMGEARPAGSQSWLALMMRL